MIFNMNVLYYFKLLGREEDMGYWNVTNQKSSTNKQNNNLTKL